MWLQVTRMSPYNKAIGGVNFMRVGGYSNTCGANIPHHHAPSFAPLIRMARDVTEIQVGLANWPANRERRAAGVPYAPYVPTVLQ